MHRRLNNGLTYSSVVYAAVLLLLSLVLLAGCDPDGEGDGVKRTVALVPTNRPAATVTQGPVQLGDQPVVVPPTVTPRPTIPPKPTATYDPGLSEWTVFIYMDADNDLEPASLLDMNELEAAGDLVGINVLVQLDRRADSSDDEDDWATARRYRVVSDVNREVISSELLQDLGEVNMGDPAQLSDFLTWGIGQYPANRYALILWDHGAGWFGTAFDDTTPAGDTTDRLLMSELDVALALTIAQTDADRFDLIGFDGCLMGQLDVLETIQPYAEYAVGSEELTPGRGWDYESWLKHLNADPTIDGRAAAITAVNDYVTYYTDTQPNDFVTMSAIDLQLLPEVTYSVERLAASLQTDPEFIAGAVADARSGAEAYARFYRDNFDFYASIDLSHFASILSQRSLDEDVATAADAVIAAIDKAVVAASHGAGFRESHGIAIYFPRAAQFLSADYAQETAIPVWHDYLQVYYESSESAVSTPEITINNTFAEEASVQNPAYYGFEVAGRGVEQVLFLAGTVDENGRRRLLEYDPLIPEPTYLPDGSRVFEWRDGVHEDFFVWLPEVTFLSDGIFGDYVVMWPTYESSRWTVAGRYRIANTDTFVNANLVFDTTTASLDSVWGYQNNSAAPYEIFPGVGDEFQIYDLYLDSNDEIQQIPGASIFFGTEQGLVYDWRAVPSGDYFLGFDVENSAGESSAAFVPLTVNNDSLGSVDRAYRDPYLGFQYQYPTSWTLPTYEPAVCNSSFEVLCARDATTGTWMYITLFPEIDRGMTANGLKSEALRIFGSVEILYEEQRSAGGLAAEYVAYGYTAADGPHTGVFITLVHEGVGYLIDVDGLANNEVATVAFADGLLASWEFKPTGFGLFPGDWARLDSGEFAVAYPSDFSYSLLSDGWNLFDAGNSTFLALRIDEDSDNGALAILQRWIDSTSGINAFSSSDAYRYALDGLIWARVDISWIDEGGRDIWGFIMVAVVDGREIVAWGEAPSLVYNETERSTFLVMISDFDLLSE